MQKIIYFLQKTLFFITLTQTKTALAKNLLTFVVLICSRNNAPWVEKNLNSVFQQKYKNFRVLYIDDGSTDGTADIVQNYIHQHNLHTVITLIRNSQRYRKIKNEYLAFHMCKDHEIIVQLDGDDWFAHDTVLSQLNHEYLTKNIWLTYGSHKNFPPSDIGSKSYQTPLNVIKKRHFRNDFIYMPTRSFYAWLAKLIKLEDCINDDVPEFEGKFYPTCDDALIMWAMLEMAHYKFKYLPNVSYIANRSNPNISIKIEMALLKKCSKSLIREMPLYDVVQDPILNRLESYDRARADVFIISENPCKLDKILPLLQNSLKNIGNVIVVYQVENNNRKNYSELEKKYPNIFFVTIHDLAYVVQQTPSFFKNEHVLAIKDAITSLMNTDCRENIKLLEKTFAYGVYMCIEEGDFQEKKIPYQHIEDDVYAWKFSCDKNHLFTIQNFNGVLYRKKNIIKSLSQYHQSLKALENTWQKNTINTKKIGLFYQKAKLSIKIS